MKFEDIPIAFPSSLPKSIVKGYRIRIESLKGYEFYSKEYYLTREDAKKK